MEVTSLQTGACLGLDHELCGTPARNEVSFAKCWHRYDRVGSRLRCLPLRASDQLPNSAGCTVTDAREKSRTLICESTSVTHKHIVSASQQLHCRQSVTLTRLHEREDGLVCESSNSQAETISVAVIGMVGDARAGSAAYRASGRSSCKSKTRRRVHVG